MLYSKQHFNTLRQYLSNQSKHFGFEHKQLNTWHKHFNTPRKLFNTPRKHFKTPRKHFNITGKYFKTPRKHFNIPRKHLNPQHRANWYQHTCKGCILNGELTCLLLLSHNFLHTNLQYFCLPGPLYSRLHRLRQSFCIFYEVVYYRPLPSLTWRRER